MRGASALQDTLESIPGPKLLALVVWEKVLETDTTPEPATLALVSDPRAVQFWDPDQLLSKAILQAAETDPALLRGEKPDVIWDVIAVFAPGARWDSTFPHPNYQGHPVVSAIDGAREALIRLRR